MAFKHTSYLIQHGMFSYKFSFEIPFLLFNYYTIIFKVCVFCLPHYITVIDVILQRQKKLILLLSGASFRTQKIAYRVEARL